MKIKEIVSALEQYAPLPLQDSFDNAGLQVGLTEADVTRVLLCLDVTEQVIEEATLTGCNLVVSHHPLLFKPLKTLTGKNYIERCVMRAVQNGIALYAAHTNLDNAEGGVNFRIAQKLGLARLQILEPKENSLCKLVVFVPVAEADAVRQALFASGCGHIGRYDACSYNLQGEGTFKAGEGAHPFCGTVGALHRETEMRIETILPVYRKETVRRALLAAHPYEEPAYDFYPLANEWRQAGAGVVGYLSAPEPVDLFLKRLKETFGAGCVKHNRTSIQKVEKIALCGGAGAFLLPKAVAAGADAFITGEIRYHEFFGYEEKLLVTEIGHYESERYTQELLYEILRKEFPQLQVSITKNNTNPIQYL